MAEVTIPELVRALGEDIPLTHQDCSDLAQRLLGRFEIIRKHAAGVHVVPHRLITIDEHAHGDQA